ncbi:penicillin-binding protein activator [Sphingosinicella rhizophila]|uniref:Penicillin-binding protein activator n=1 Tax=Sphingosinicella rhizophila TaxID=3050082 RepID=A0ABU3Q8Z7_9SPHN|nr:penicillin-binding protein activator [Sphingosinicella sp. GR2756]MDT9599787.1 penicillin-binding protein activator [Sphingosinicella sp. GR2756]
MAEQPYSPQARRAFPARIAMALLALFVAGCQIVPSSRVPDRPPPQRPQPTPEEPDVSPLPRDETRNRVAVLVPMTGPNAGVGMSIANAANLALLDTGGEKIRITVYDTARSGGAVAAANEALAQGNRLFLGPLLSEDVQAIAPIARRARVPLISFSNDASIAGNGVYMMGFTPDQSVARVVSFARSKGVQRFAALVPDGVYGRRASQAMIEAVEDAGGRLIGMQRFDRSPNSLRTAITRLKAQGGYDAVLIADGGRIAVSAAPLLRAGPSSSARILGTELWSTETDLGRTAGLRGSWYASVPDTMFNQLRTRYRARYGANPYRLASLGYDAVLLAVRVGRDWPVGRNFPERALRDDAGFTGVDGAFRFRSDGVAERSLAVHEVTPGGTTILSPAPRSFTD